MFPFRSESLQVCVLGSDDLVELLSGRESEGSIELAVGSASEGASVDDPVREQADCLVFEDGVASDDAVQNGSGVGGTDLPVVVVTGEQPGDVAPELVREAATTLPRPLVEAEPGAAVDQLVAAVERERARRGFREVYERVAGTVSIHDPDSGELLHANRQLCALLGYDRSELLSMRVGDFTAEIPGYDHQRAMRVVTSVAEQDRAMEVEWPLETTDGAVRWVESELQPVTVAGREFVLSVSADVTERKRREREYEQIFDTVTDAISVHDPWEGEMVEVNEALCDLTGYARETVLELDLAGLRAGESGPDEPFYAIQRRVAATGESETVEWRAGTAAGDRRVLETTLTPATITGDDRVLAISRDVTERRELERTYRAVFENVSDGLVVHDPETGEIRNVNERFCEMNGYDREDLIGETVDVITAPDHDYERAHERIRAARTEGSQLFEWRNQRADGGTFPVEVHLSIVDVRGEERVLASVRDITERKRREREYEQIFDAVTDAITVHDPETGELLDVNETMCDLTGYDREELLSEGQSLINVPEHGYSTERARQIIAEAMETGEQRTIDWLIEREDGQRRWLEATTTPATLNGQQRYVGILRDVTERRRTERRLRAILDRIDEAIYLTRATELTDVSEEPDYLSAGHEAIWGQSFETIRETYEEGFLGTLHPEDAPDYRAFLEELVREIEDGTAADSYTREYRIERPDGEVRWVQSDYYPIEWEIGPPRVVIVGRDVTARKERERRIASFEAATDDLATADSPGEATRSAVEAASDDLDLPAVGAFLYDDDEGILRPAARSGSMPGPDDGGIGPDGGPVWEAFATGSVVAPDGDTPLMGESDAGDGTGDDSGGDGLADWRVIALGNHGVLVVGTPEGAIDPDTLQAAHVLGATLEAALNHLRGQDRLAVQEEQLQAQTARAERLDRIARLTRQVEAAITEASDPREVERAVCERLAGTGPYAAAWCGGVDVGTDRLAPRAVVGASTRYVEGLDLVTTDGGADRHPAVRAWQSEDLAVAESLIDGGPGDWRRHALSAGYQSICAIPLTYDGITYGVLAVAADSPNAFGERERDVLDQLGTSVGYALAAIERRRTLESDETVELEFRGEGADLRFARLARETDCRVRHERTVPREDGEVSVYVTVEGDFPDGIADVADRVLSGRVDVVTEEADSVVLEVITGDWFGSLLAEYGAVLREATATPTETTVVVEVSAGADVRSFGDRLRDLAPSLELAAKRQHRRRDRTPEELRSRVEAELTDRQYEVLQTALSAGYFEWPRESDGQDVADRLGITQPTFNKHMRLGERQTFEILFGEE